jgi:hypothetical protein
MTITNPMTPADRIRARPDFFGYDTAPALADLLDEFHRHDTAVPECHVTDVCWDAVADRIEALEAVILRTLPVTEARP